MGKINKDIKETCSVTYVIQIGDIIFHKMDKFSYIMIVCENIGDIDLVGIVDDKETEKIMNKDDLKVWASKWFYHNVELGWEE